MFGRMASRSRIVKLYQMKSLICAWLVVLFPIAGCQDDQEKNWLYHFPEGSSMGIFVAVAVPLDLPKKNIFVAYNIEANYVLPGNQTDFSSLPPILSERGARMATYTSLENKLVRSGRPGRDCILRAICEVSTYAWDHNGLLGDLVHVLFTPSTSIEPILDNVYHQAEESGRNGDCGAYIATCPFDILEMFSKVFEEF